MAVALNNMTSARPNQSTHKVPVLGKWMKYHKPNQQASHTPTCSPVGAIFNHKLTKKEQNSRKKKKKRDYCGLPINGRWTVRAIFQIRILWNFSSQQKSIKQNTSRLRVVPGGPAILSSNTAFLLFSPNKKIFYNHWLRDWKDTEV